VGTGVVSATARRPGRARLAAQDRLLARIAELHHIRCLLEETTVLVERGWVQNAWVAVRDARGQQHDLTAHQMHLAAGRPVSGVCLVGGLVLAAGGPPAVHTQLVQRTLDLMWHSLHEEVRRPVRWCPPPAVRAAHVRDLTRWNDAPMRTPGDVVALLGSAVLVADTEIGARRAGLGAVAAR
jgi:hypothetical protein